ncbi:pectinesterase family protein [Brachybacterium sp. YJGR34]|uniref:pectinesterase family protein n=1 Tax=Brachybacterium sp. YJGR34 TaxID=2059911 RepID=UPI0018E62CC9|nr:pectinesterase family protein [Brachybacterium sp. YJGR34]
MRSIPRRHVLSGAVVGGAALAAGSAVPATAAPPADPSDLDAQAEDLLRRLRVPKGPATADGPVWSPLATGFAGVPDEALPHGAVGGLGGEIVTVSTSEQLAAAIVRREPTVVLVDGSITIEPFGTTLPVSSHTTIAGIGRTAEIVGGGFQLEQVSNVVFRNLTLRDSYLAGDWDGKDNDVDGIRVDTSDHVWIDHCEFVRLGDGQVDLRKNSTALTVSWSIFRDHNKSLGVGWTDDVVTTLTVHHTAFWNTYQRNGSIDNVAAGHLYNNHLHGQAHYGTMSRGASQLLVEASVYEEGEDAIVAKDEASRVDSRGNRFHGIRGRKDHTGATFEASDHYSYAADPVDEVPALLAEHAGPHARREKVGRRVRVALDGSGEFASVSAAVGATSRSSHPVEIVVAPGEYREIVRVWSTVPAGSVLRGETGDAADVTITYDLANGSEKFYGGSFGRTGGCTLAVLADAFTLADLTLVNAYDEQEHGNSQALALRTVADRVVLDGLHLVGNQDTFLAETPNWETSCRVYTVGSVIEGDVDFVYGNATMVVEDSEIRCLDRGSDSNNGYVCAPSTATGNLGFLFTGCTFTAEPGMAEESFHLGRPWHPSSHPDVSPSAVIRDSHLGAHVRTPAWSDMGGWPWEEDFLRERDNTGPGAVPAGGDTTGRPQLTDEEAALHTRETYLTGADDWAPWA